MQIINPQDLQVYDDDHPTGSLSQRYLFEGEDLSPDNYMFSIAETIGRFTMKSHRHNFDQFRMALKGDMTMGKGRRLREGWLGYFPEGATYGPQDDMQGPIALVLQFGGASGYGYMSMQQYRDGRAKLSKTGHFEGPVYIRENKDGTLQKKFSINAIWEEALNAKLLIPTARYDNAIFMNPQAYRWAKTPHVGVSRKHLGTFSEREVKAEIWRLDAKAELPISADNAIHLIYVLNGQGTANGQVIKEQFGVRLVSGDSTILATSSDCELEVLSFTMPLVNTEWEEAQDAAFEPTLEESV